jgi:pimeloyl-ACP methyl ester carboxylesterase
MPTFDSAGVSIHYEVFGEGQPIVLVHGFAANLQLNWVASGWIDTLRPLRQVIAIDCRGHGESEKPYDPSAYGEAMEDDVIRLMDHLKIQTADLFGYSMGGRISLGLLARYPRRFSRAILGGVGAGAMRRDSTGIVQALLAHDATSVTDPVAKGYRNFAERTGADLKALAAVRQGFRRLDLDALANVPFPVLIVVGENDAVVGDPHPLAKLIPTAQVMIVPDKDHLTVVADQRFKDAVVAFLSEPDS